MYEQAPRLLGDHEFGFDFIAENAKDVFDTPDFAALLTRSRLLTLIQSSELKIKEVIDIHTIGHVHVGYVGYVSVTNNVNVIHRLIYLRLC
jgi:hypothetical protein